MKIETGKTYTIRNIVEPEYAPFTVTDLHPYQGQYIVYGELHAHTVVNPRNLVIVQVPARASCVVILPSADRDQEVHFLDAIKGAPLILESGNDFKIAMNMQALPGMWDGNKKDKNGMLGYGMRLINLWQEWKLLGERLPVWFRDLQQEARK